MALKIRDKKDFNAGLMFIAFGAIFALVARNYPMGTAVRMGPSYFPTILGALLIVLGIVIFIRGLTNDGPPPNPTRWRPLLWILGSVLVFALLVGTAGIIVASMALTLVASYGGHEFRWKEQVIEAIILAAAVVAIFAYGLGLPFKLFPWSY